MRGFYLRRAEPEDLDAIETVFNHGREFLRGQGLPQWQNGSGPAKRDAAGDIERGEGFALVNGGGKANNDDIKGGGGAERGAVCGYAALIKGADGVYSAIRRLDAKAAGGLVMESQANGAWDETWADYVSIHRVALSNAARGRGLGKIFLSELIREAASQGFHDVRIDTHAGNKPMRRVIEGLGFTLRGEVEFPFPNGERMAYQLLIQV